MNAPLSSFNHAMTHKCEALHTRTRGVEARGRGHTAAQPRQCRHHKKSHECTAPIAECVLFDFFRSPMPSLCGPHTRWRSFSTPVPGTSLRDVDACVRDALFVCVHVYGLICMVLPALCACRRGKVRCGNLWWDGQSSLSRQRALQPAPLSWIASSPGTLSLSLCPSCTAVAAWPCGCRGRDHLPTQVVCPGGAALVQ